MIQRYGLYCDCCGLTVDTTQIELCPRCQYPVQLEREQRFLETALHDLKRVMHYGGAAISVSDLAGRYEGRLQFLRNLKDRSPVPLPTQASAPLSQAEEDAELTALQTVELQPVAPLAPTASMQGSSFSSDAVANILAALGGFFVLVGSLSFVLTTSNLWLSFLAVFFLHILFGGAGQLTQRRFPLLRAVSPLYTFIFALLVPLVGFSAYRLVTGGLVEFSPSALLTLAALYAAAIYIILAVTQRFALFAYLGMVALLVGDLAFAQTLHLAYWWWPCIAMLLALLTVLALPRTATSADAWAILRTPLHSLMFAIVVIVCALFPFMWLISLLLDRLHTFSTNQEAHLALFTLFSMVFAWFAVWIWRTRRITWTPWLAYLLVGVLVLLGYVLRLDLTGYLLLLTGTALGYHMLVRVAGAQLAPYGLPGLTLDQLAIGLSTLVVLLVAGSAPFQLIYHDYVGSSVSNVFLLIFGDGSSSPFLHGNHFVLGQLMLGMCCLLTFDIAIMRAGFRRIPTSTAWCWLLLLSSLILVAVFIQELLFWQIVSLQALLALSFVLLASAVLTRRSTSSAWANPLYVTALLAAVLTGLYGALGDIRQPFYGASLLVLLLYALVTFVGALLERQPAWNWLVAGWACWAMLLAQRLTPTYALGAGLGLVVLGWLSGRFCQPISTVERSLSAPRAADFTWSWPWYVAFLVAAFELASWPYLSGSLLTPGMLVPAMLVCTLLATGVMLVERAPEFVIIPAGMAAWTLHLWLAPSQPALAIVAYTLLGVLLFVTQFTWYSLPAATLWLPETSLHNALSLGGLCLVVLDALSQGALSANAGTLAQAGVFALVVLSLLLFFYGLAHPATAARVLAEGMSASQCVDKLDAAYAVCHWCMYGAGVLLSLAISWELLVFNVTQFDALTLVPASYLIVIAPFLLHDTALPERRFMGQVVALLGAALLLLPALWSSFNGSDLLPTFLLLAEALLLLVLGMLTRMRMFILSSTALIVLATLRMLFLSLPPSGPIVLIVFGCVLILLATVLMLSRHRLQVAWSHWE